MILHDTMAALEALPFAQAIRMSGVLFPWIESLHVLAVAVVVGLVAIMDLRLLGLPGHSRSVRRLMDDILPFTWTAFAVAAISGFLLFASSATTYVDSLPLRLKFAAMAVAGVNMVVFHMVTQPRLRDWDHMARPPGLARVAGALSILCWVCVVAAGRWIGFVG